MFDWKKLGCVFCPNQQYSWMMSHASNPVPVMLQSGIVRVYFTCRDALNRSHIAFVDLDFDNDFKIVSM